MGGRHRGPENPLPATGMAGVQSGDGTGVRVQLRELAGGRNGADFSEGAVENRAVPRGRASTLPGDDHEKRGGIDVEAVGAARSAGRTGTLARASGWAAGEFALGDVLVAESSRAGACSRTRRTYSATVFTPAA